MGTDHNLSMTGALKNMPYRVSVGYTNQNGTQLPAPQCQYRFVAQVLRQASLC